MNLWTTFNSHFLKYVSASFRILQKQRVNVTSFNTSESRGLFDGGLHNIRVVRLVRAFQDCSFGPQHLTWYQIGDIDEVLLVPWHGPLHVNGPWNILQGCYKALDRSQNSYVFEAMNLAFKGGTSMDLGETPTRLMVDFDARYS